VGEADAQPSAEKGDQASSRYTRVAIALHWTIAALIAFNLLFGFGDISVFPAPARRVIIELHSSVGMTVLVLTGFRILWRLTHAPPPPRPAFAPWERSLARTTQFFLYFLMVALPLTGWAIVSANPPRGSAGFETGPPAAESGAAGNRPTRPLPRDRPAVELWWVADLPLIGALQRIGGTEGGVAPQEQLHDELIVWHCIAAYLMLLLLALHLGGAAKHHFIGRDRHLARIGVGTGRRHESFRAFRDGSALRRALVSSGIPRL
jgi:cytochrome b561